MSALQKIADKFIMVYELNQKGGFMRAEDGLRNGRVVIFPYEGRGIGDLGFVLNGDQEESLRRLLNERDRIKQSPDYRKAMLTKAVEQKL